MKVTYVGPYEGVEVPLPSGSAIYAERDKAVDVPPDVARGLLVQEDIWSEPKSKTKEAK